MGILLAIIALFSWGIGDFLIQRSTRKFGDWASLFFITALGSIALLPFAWADIPNLFQDRESLLILIIGTLVMFVAALIDFEALKRGKISVIETVYAFEIPIAGLLAGSILAEQLSPVQTILILTIVLGIALTTTKDMKRIGAIRWERGVALAVAATVGMGAVNFLVGWGGRETNAVVVNWFITTGVALLCFIELVATRQLRNLLEDWKKHTHLILFVSFFDNLAWVAFAGSAILLPIAIATAISESYIVIAAILGIVYNHEKNEPHQNIGLAVTVMAASALALLS